MSLKPSNDHICWPHQKSGPNPCKPVWLDCGVLWYSYSKNSFIFRQVRQVQPLILKNATRLTCSQIYQLIGLLTHRERLLESKLNVSLGTVNLKYREAYRNNGMCKLQQYYIIILIICTISIQYCSSVWGHPISSGGSRKLWNFPAKMPELNYITKHLQPPFLSFLVFHVYTHVNLTEKILYVVSQEHR